MGNSICNCYNEKSIFTETEEINTEKDVNYIFSREDSEINIRSNKEYTVKVQPIIDDIIELEIELEESKFKEKFDKDFIKYCSTIQERNSISELSNSRRKFSFRTPLTRSIK